MLVRCPNCADLFEAPEKVKVPHTEKGVAGWKTVPTAPLTFAEDGTAFRHVSPDEERHVDMRLRCPKCSIHQR